MTVSLKNLLSVWWQMANRSSSEADFRHHESDSEDGLTAEPQKARVNLRDLNESYVVKITDKLIGKGVGSASAELLMRRQRKSNAISD